MSARLNRSLLAAVIALGILVPCATSFSDEPPTAPKEWRDLAKYTAADAEKYPDLHRQDVELFVDPDPTSDKPAKVGEKIVAGLKALAHETEGVLKPLLVEMEDNVKWNNGGKERFKKSFAGQRDATDEEIENGRQVVLARIKRIGELADKLMEGGSYQLSMFKPTYSRQEKEQFRMARVNANDPDRIVYLTKEFFAFAHSAAQRAAILAHELSHFNFEAGDGSKDPAEIKKLAGLPLETALDRMDLMDRFSSSYYLQRYFLESYLSLLEKSEPVSLKWTDLWAKKPIKYVVGPQDVGIAGTTWTDGTKVIRFETDGKVTVREPKTKYFVAENEKLQKNGNELIVTYNFYYAFPDAIDGAYFFMEVRISDLQADRAKMHCTLKFKSFGVDKVEKGEGELRKQ